MSTPMPDPKHPCPECGREMTTCYSSFNATEYYLCPATPDQHRIRQLEAALAAAEKEYERAWERGYYCAVATLLRETGCADTDVRSLFKQGGDPAQADHVDRVLFAEHGLMETPQ